MRKRRKEPQLVKFVPHKLMDEKEEKRVTTCEVCCTQLHGWEREKGCKL
jgi:hypothetical protein